MRPKLQDSRNGWGSWYCDEGLKEDSKDFKDANRHPVNVMDEFETIQASALLCILGRLISFIIRRQ